jgi:ribokinase
VGQVIVVGSVNADYAVRVGHLPQPGETVTGGRLEILPGGKGANQATAAARLGAQVTLVAAVGRDAAGDQAMADLLAEGIDAAGLLRCDAPSGVAVILVDAAGENMIAVAPGANERLTAAVTEQALTDRVSAGTVLLASLEVPLEAVSAAAAAAERADGAVLIVNPAPGRALPPELVRGVILTPNEGELLRLPQADVSSGGPGQDGRPDEAAAVAHLLAAEARAVIVTRGGRGATMFRPGEAPADFPAPAVDVVDTVGAGDAFNGALATALAAALPLEIAVTAAVEAGAAACTGAGARQALPRAGDIAALRGPRADRDPGGTG